MNYDFRAWCRQHCIRATTTQGHDPNANASAENAVGAVNRYARYLLSSKRISTDYWGVACLAAGHLLRVKAGFLPPPRLEFGARVMVVQDTKPRNSSMPRTKPGTIFGVEPLIQGVDFGNRVVVHADDARLDGGNVGAESCC